MKYVKFSIIFVFFVLLLTNCGGNSAPGTPNSPEGPASGLANVSLTFQTTTTDPNDDNISYQFDWGEGNLSLWSSYAPSGDTISVTHSYSESGTYEVIVRAQDEKEKTSEWSEPHNISIGLQDSNLAPLTPNSPEGPITGVVNVLLSFEATTTDPNDDSISYQFDWGDGTLSSWSNYVPSGDTASIAHSYLQIGTYTVKVHAQDEEKTSGWSEPYNISIGHIDTNLAPLTPNSPEVPVIGIPNFVHVFQASTTDPDGDEISYQFDWGDGTVSPWSDFIPSGDTVSMNRIYWGKGTYEVRVHAQDEKEEKSAWSEPLSFEVGFPDELVTICGTGLYPSDIEVLPNGQRIYVTSYDDGTVRVIDCSNNSPMGDISVGTEPIGVTALPNSQYVYIMVNGEDFVLALPVLGGSPDTIPVPDPYYATALPSGEYVYVTSYLTDNVYVIRTSDNSVVDSIDVGSHPYAIETLPSGEYIYVSTSYNTYVIRTSDNTIIDNFSIEASDMDVSPNGQRLYMCSYTQVYVVRTSNNTVIDTLHVGGDHRGVCVHPTGLLIYVTDHSGDEVSVIYTPTNKIIENIEVADGPTYIDPSPSGEYIYVLHNQTYCVGIIGYSE